MPGSIMIYKFFCNFAVMKTSDKKRPFGARRRYRVELINGNTLSRVFSLQFEGFKAILAGVAVIAAMASLVAVIFMFTPLSQLIPGRLRGDLRSQYIETALRVDSLEHVSRANSAYMANIQAILSDSLPEQVIPDMRQPSAVVDSLVSAGDAERRFVKQFEEEQRFNVSVLSPIAAEGMIFLAPTETDAGVGPVSAVYRGSVIAVYTDPRHGLSSVIVQHPNDFISTYTDLKDVYVERGDKVIAGQRIGSADAVSPMSLELWHSGLKLDPTLYIAY